MGHLLQLMLLDLMLLSHCIPTISLIFFRRDIHPATRSICHSFTHSIVHLLTDRLTHSLTHSLTASFTSSLSDSPSHLPTHMSISADMPM